MSYFATELSRIMSARDIPQKRIAEACGVSTAQVSRLLRARDTRRASRETVARLLRSDIFDGPESNALLAAFLLDETPEDFVLQLKPVLESWSATTADEYAGEYRTADARLDRALNHIRERARHNEALYRLVMDLERIAR